MYYEDPRQLEFKEFQIFVIQETIKKLASEKRKLREDRREYQRENKIHSNKRALKIDMIIAQEQELKMELRILHLISNLLRKVPYKEVELSPKIEEVPAACVIKSELKYLTGEKIKESVIKTWLEEGTKNE